MKCKDFNWNDSPYQYSDGTSVYKEADLGYWAKMPYWTHLELTCVSLGFEPSPILNASLEQLQSHDRNFENISKRAQLAYRAVEIEELPKTISPNKAIKWLISIDENYPSELKKLIDDLPIYAEGPLPNLSSGDIAIALSSVEKLSEAAQAAERCSKHSSAQTKEITSLQKLLLTTVVKGYGYKPNARRSPIYGEIANDSVTLDVNVHTDTVRKHIRAAVDNHWTQIDG